MKPSTIIAKILEEREQQDIKWGIQHHTHLEWLGILVEEVGEAAKAIVQQWIDEEGDRHDEIVKEIIQIAAVCVAWLEDRGT